MRPSPIREEYHRCSIVSPASNTARTATISESRITTLEFWGVTPLSTRSLSSRGTATMTNASTTTSTRKTMIGRRNGRAYFATRRVVPGVSFRSTTSESRVMDRMTIHPDMLTASPP